MEVLAALLLGLVAAWPIYKTLAEQQAGIQPSADSRGHVSIGRMYRYLALVALGDYDLVGTGRWFRMPVTVCALAAATGLIAALRRRGVLARLAGPHAEPETAGAVDDLARAKGLTRYIVCWAGGFTVIMFLFSNLVQNMAGHPRYYTPITGGMSLAFAVAIHAIARSRRRHAFAAVLAASLLTVTVGWWMYLGDGLVDALHRIEGQRTPEERVIGCDDVAGINAYRFYASDIYDRAFVGLTRWEHSAAKVADLLRKNAAAGQRLWLLVYHQKESPIVYVASHDAEFEVVFHDTFGEAQVWCLRRKAPAG